MFSVFQNKKFFVKFFEELKYSVFNQFSHKVQFHNKVIIIIQDAMNAYFGAFESDFPQNISQVTCIIFRKPLNSLYVNFLLTRFDNRVPLFFSSWSC